jgi:hypothetical protein
LLSFIEKVGGQALPEAPGRLPVLRGALVLVAFSTAASSAIVPTATLAGPAYAVASPLDASKLPGSAAQCRSQAAGNPCTLRAAIETANGFATGATIQVPGNLPTIAIDPAKGPLSVSASMTIEAAGPGAPRLDGAGAVIPLILNGPVAVTVSGLTIQNGSGGGILNSGATATLLDMTVQDTVGGDGIVSTGPLSMSGGSVTQNPGGGIVLVEEATLDHVSVSHNAGDGGLLTVAPLTLRDGSVSDNQAAGTGAGLLALGTLDVTGTSIARNVTGSAGGGVVVGASARLTRVRVEDNVAAEGGAGVLVVPVISATASATITESAISGNSGPGGGGGLAAVTAGLSLSDSVVSRNVSSDNSGGGVFAIESSVALSNDTIAGNAAPGFGGGGIAQVRIGTASPLPAAGAKVAQVATDRLLAARDRFAALKLPGRGLRAQRAVHAAPAAPSPGDVALDSVTLAGNSAARGGGLSNDSGLLVTLHDTIVGNNAASASGPDCGGQVTSRGYNLEGGTDCRLNGTGDQQGAGVGLGPLSANGGPTASMALLPDSPAIDTGDPACPPPGRDQRGVSRPQGPRCDIGAFEEEESVAGPLPAPPATGHAGGPARPWPQV